MACLLESGGARELTTSARGRHKAVSKRNLSQIDPVILGLLPYESEIAYLNASGMVEFRPASAGDPVRMLRLVLGAHFDNRQMWHVGPFFLPGEGFDIQAVMQLAHTIRGVRHPDENRRGHRNKSFNLTQRNLKRFDVATERFHRFYGR